MKRTKIIATLGPACDDETILGRMIAAGLNVIRINFSHARHESLSASIERVRRAAATAGAPDRAVGRPARTPDPGGRDDRRNDPSRYRQRGDADARNGARDARADFRLVSRRSPATSGRVPRCSSTTAT